MAPGRAGPVPAGSPAITGVLVAPTRPAPSVPRTPGRPAELSVGVAVGGAAMACDHEPRDPPAPRSRGEDYDRFVVEREVVMITVAKKELSLAWKLTLLCAAVVAVAYVVLAAIGR